jgi:hypothetical protein
VKDRVSRVAHLPFGLAIALAVTAASLGCMQTGTIGAVESREETGSVGLALQLAPGVNVSSASYTVTGPNGYTTSGTVAVGSNSNVPVVLSGLPAGEGYILSVSAVASDGLTMCTGTSSFDVQQGVTSTIIVHLVCRLPTTGNANVDATFNICPVLDSMGASPGEALIGGSIALEALARDPDNGPAPLTYSWTVDGVPLAGSSASRLFTCNQAGTFEIAATVSDGSPDPTCADTLSVSVTCTAP